MMEPAPRLHHPGPRSSRVLTEILINDSKMTIPRSHSSHVPSAQWPRGAVAALLGCTEVAHGLGELATCRASLEAQMAMNLPVMQETQVQSLGQEDPLEEGMATLSSVLAWRIPWTEERVGYSPWVTQSDMTE